MKRKASPPTLPARITSLCRDGRGRGVAALAAELQVPEHAIRSALGELLQRKAIICTASTVNRGQGSHAVMLYSLPVVTVEPPAIPATVEATTPKKRRAAPKIMTPAGLCPLCNGGLVKVGRNPQGDQRYKCRVCKKHCWEPTKKEQQWTTRQRAAYEQRRQRM